MWRSSTPSPDRRLAGAAKPEKLNPGRIPHVAAEAGPGSTCRMCRNQQVESSASSTLKKSLHRRLSAAYGRAWYENRRVGVGDGCMERIQSVETGLARSDGERIPPAQVVAGMNRKQAHAALDQLRILRNRIAHHEPIFNRDLADDYRQILEVTGWISPTTSEWLAWHSRVQAILDAPWDSGEMHPHAAVFPGSTVTRNTRRTIAS